MPEQTEIIQSNALQKNISSREKTPKKFYALLMTFIFFFVAIPFCVLIIKINMNDSKEDSAHSTQIISIQAITPIPITIENKSEAETALKNLDSLDPMQFEGILSQFNIEVQELSQ